jgi:aspartate/methionine/tyrosine aminotransferase
MPGLKPSTTAQALMEARHLSGLHHVAANGADAIELNRGHTGFVTPDHIREAALAAIRDGHTHYEDVLPLREAIAAKLARENRINVDPIQEIVVGGGSHLVLFDVMKTFVDPGDEVIFGRPGSPTYFYYNTVINGGKPVFIPLKKERRYKIDPDDIAAAITPRTKILGLTNPDTPAGAMAELADLERIAALAIEHDLLVISDEIYEKLTFGMTPHVSIASLPGMRERTITVNGFSKCYAMTGWRVGYAAGPRALIKPLQDVFLTNCIWLNTPAQYAALAAITGPQDSVREMRAEYERRMHLLAEGINSIEGFTCFEPEGGYYLWPDVSGFGLHSTEFANKVMEYGQVRVGPGAGFGPAAGEHNLRLSFSETEENLREGLRRLSLACERLRSEM